MMTKPKTKRQLWGFIYAHFGLAIPYRTFTDGFSNPFDFIADAFFNPAKDIAVWANRSGIKTLGASILAALEFAFTDGLHARVLSGSEDQARNLYEYWSQWACMPMLRSRVEGNVGKLMTRVGGGSFEILAASQKRVRGPKLQKLFRDEIDETDPDILDASVGMLAGTDNIPSRIIDCSTYHRADGPMARLVEGIDRSGVTLHKWGLWESLEKCPVKRHDMGRGCENCPLEKPCRRKACEYFGKQKVKVGIASKCRGLFRIDDAIKNYRRWSLVRWQAEAECKRPGVEGVVFSEFDGFKHRRRQQDIPDGLKIYRSIDWGCGVFVCLWIGEDRDGTAYLLDTYRAENATVHQHAKYINQHPINRIEQTFCDPAGRNRNDQSGRSNIDVFKGYGINCSYTLRPSAREVRNGIALIKSALEPASGEPKFYYVQADSNRVFVKAMQSYHNRKINGIWTDQPQDPQEFEHIPDALRYYFVNRRTPQEITVVRLGVN